MYYNQYAYKDIPYPSPTYRTATLATSGCGVCCAAMVAEGLTGRQADPVEVAGLALEEGARVSGGTDMSRLSEALCRRYRMTCATANGLDTMAKALREGCWVIANTGGDRPGYRGILSNGGHYVVVRGVSSRGLIVWDPGLYDGKFHSSARRDRVTVEGCDIHILPEDLDTDCQNRRPRYYIFRGDNMTQEDFDRMMADWLRRRGQLPASGWAQETVKRAVGRGITDGGRPQAFATREEAMAMVLRLRDEGRA